KCFETSIFRGSGAHCTFAREARRSFQQARISALEISSPCLLRREEGSDILAKKRRMGDLQEQLTELRMRIARIDRNYATRSHAPAPEALQSGPQEPVLPKPAHHYVEEWLSGEEVETSFGRHFETERLYESHRRHGSADIGSLADLPSDLLSSLAADEFPEAL